MTTKADIFEFLKSSRVKKLFGMLYGDSDQTVQAQIKRYAKIVEKYYEIFGQDCDEAVLFSTPGRTEVGGNHTDHNFGRVLAAGVNLDSVAAASKTDDSVITVYSEGYPDPFVVDLRHLSPKAKEEGTTSALVRGTAARFHELGFDIGGFNAYISSNVLIGSGLSSSASIEVLLGTILNHFYNQGKIKPETLSMIGQYAENRYFNKPCGLMDQIACAVGGFVAIDFKNPSDPLIRRVNFDFDSQDYSLLVVDTGGNHADLTEDYASIPLEMKKVAQLLGAEVCREITYDQIAQNIARLRSEAGDRAVMRAMHFLDENQRVHYQVQALESGDFKRFLQLVIESGNSSFKWLQNCYTMKNPKEQNIALALAITEKFLQGKEPGAYRVHGGGFAGTIQVFMHNSYLNEYVSQMKTVFGEKAATVLRVRPLGTICIQEAAANI